MIILLDNFDSFTYNLVHLLYALNSEVKVLRNNQCKVEEILALRPDAVIFSSGPGLPEKAGIMMPLLEACRKERLPVLGISLGCLALGKLFSAEIVSAKEIMHGKTSRIAHDGQALFEGIKQDFKAVRYHSLVLREESLPENLQVTARSEDNEVMGIKDSSGLMYALQYQPDSILSSNGKQQMANFLKIIDKYKNYGS